MPLDSAWNAARERFKGINAPAAAAKSSAPYDNSYFSLRFFNRSFLVRFPEATIDEVGIEKAPPLPLQILLLHYLTMASGVPVADRWLTYRHLPGVNVHEQKFEGMAIRSMVQAFGQDLAGFKRAGLALGGTPIDRTGDAGYRFLALPRIPMACILYLGDEEVASSVSILFDAASPNYLPTDDLSVLGAYLSSALRQLKAA